MSASGKLGELPQQACRAFSTWTFGRHYDQHHMALEGSVAYGKTVASLRDSLARVANGTYIGQPLKELLLPILILLLHSNVSMARAESLSHIKGLTALLQACGAEAICCEGVLQAFSSARATLLAFSMLQQKRLFLEAKTWRTTPWAHAPESKSSQDKLLDVLVMVPGFLEETHDMTLNTSIGKRDLYERVAHQLHLLFTWRWKADKLQTATEKERSEDAFLSGQDCPRAASQVLRLDSFTTAFELALYDSILLCLMGLLQSLASPCRVHACIRDAALSSRPHDSPASMSNGNSAILLTPDNVSTVRSVAIELVRAFEQTIQQVQHCQIGSLFWLFPIDVAAKVLSRDPEWHPWIQRMLDTAKSTSSFKNSGELFRLSFSPWQKDVSFEAAEAATAKDTEPSISQHQYWRQTRQREKENSQVSQESQLFIDGLVLRQHQAMRTSPCA